MDNQKIIIALLGVIIALLIVGVVMFSPLMAKEDINIEFLDQIVNVGDSISVKLIDSKGNPISDETIHIKLTDKDDGVTIDESVTTNSKGKAKFKMEEKGDYNAEFIFDGNDKYSSSSTKGTVNVKKATTQSVSEQQTSTHSSKYAPNGGIYPEYGPEVDSHGITREYAIANNMHYIEMTIDGKTVGGYTAIDPNTGTYHTWGNMMENKNIVIILVIVVVVLAAVLGAMFLQSANAKEPTKLKITSDKTQYEGGKLTVQLTDLNKTAISKEKVNITITNKKGKVIVNETVKTNSKGKAKLDLDLKKGKYTVNVTYGGNENYTGNNTAQKLTIKEPQTTSSYSSEPVYDGHTVSYQDGKRGVYSESGEFFIDPTQDPSYQTFS